MTRFLNRQYEAVSTSTEKVEIFTPAFSFEVLTKGFSFITGLFPLPGDAVVDAGDIVTAAPIVTKDSGDITSASQSSLAP